MKLGAIEFVLDVPELQNVLAKLDIMMLRQSHFRAVAQATAGGGGYNVFSGGLD